MSNNNPLLSEDDDSSLSNYQGSTDSSKNLSSHDNNDNNIISRNRSGNSSLVNSRLNLNSSNDNIADRLNSLSIAIRNSKTISGTNQNQRSVSDHNRELQENDIKTTSDAVGNPNDDNQRYNERSGQQRESGNDGEDESDEDAGQRQDDAHGQQTRSRVIKDAKIAETKLSKANSDALENLSKSFYHEGERFVDYNADFHQTSDNKYKDTNNYGDITVDSAPNLNKEEVIEKILASHDERVSKNPVKVLIRFQSIGSTKQIEPRVYKISNNQQFSLLIKFLNKKFRAQKSRDEGYRGADNGNGNGSAPQSVFCYIHNSFSPSADEVIGNLFQNFATNNELIISYCENVAFG